MLSAMEVVTFAGCSYRQLDYWTRTGMITPEVGARGSGSRRMFTDRQAFAVRLVTDLAVMGAPYSVRRGAFRHALQLTDWTGLRFVDDEGRLSIDPPGGSCWVMDLDVIAGRGRARERISA